MKQNTDAWQRKFGVDLLRCKKRLTDRGVATLSSFPFNPFVKHNLIIVHTLKKLIVPGHRAHVTWSTVLRPNSHKLNQANFQLCSVLVYLALALCGQDSQSHGSGMIPSRPQIVPPDWFCDENNSLTESSSPMLRLIAIRWLWRAANLWSLWFDPNNVLQKISLPVHIVSTQIIRTKRTKSHRDSRCRIS